MKTGGRVVYELDPALDEAALVARLELRLGTQELRPVERTVTLYDTFDWRLWRRRRQLALATAGGRGRSRGTLEISDLDGELLFRLPDAPEPVFAADLPPGPLREALESPTAGRRLLPRVRLRCHRRGWRLLDERGKTLVRLFLDRCDASSPGHGEGRPLPGVLRLEPVRGYSEARQRVLEELEDLDGLRLREGDELTTALAALDRRPGDYSSKVELHLDPETRADVAMKQVHRALVAAMRSNEDGTRRDLDSEFLHDLRVAVRRARTVLGQVSGVFPPKVVERFQRELAWLGKVTGPTRDLDVYRIKLEGYRRELPAVAADLDRLGEYLEDHRREEQQRLAEILDSPRYHRFMTAWESFLERPVPVRTVLPNARKPILEVAARRIWRVWKRVIARGTAISPESPAEALHEVRIDCKKLRYLLELFRSLFDQEEVARTVRALKRLQDSLGDYNDFEVQQEMLQAFARGMAEEGSAPVSTLLAMGRLVERLAQAQEVERLRFEERFARFARAGNHRRFKTLFGPKAVARRLAPVEEGG